MSTPAPPPRKHKKSDDHRSYTGGSGDKSQNLFSSGIGSLQQHQQPYSVRGGYEDRPAWASASPDSVIGEEVVISGEMRFDRLLRIDGRFEGALVTKGGNLIIGSTGVLVGNVNNVAAMIVEGKVTGNILVDTLHLRGSAVVHGDVSCKSITVDPKVIICGNVNIHPQAPKYIDSNGSIVAAPPRPVPSRKNSLRNPAAAIAAAASTGTAESGSTGTAESGSTGTAESASTGTADKDPAVKAAGTKPEAKSPPAPAAAAAKKAEEKKAEEKKADAKKVPTPTPVAAAPAKTEEKKDSKDTPHIEPAPAEPEPAAAKEEAPVAEAPAE